MSEIVDWTIKIRIACSRRDATRIRLFLEEAIDNDVDLFESLIMHDVQHAVRETLP